MASFSNQSFSRRRYSVKSKKKILGVQRTPYKKPRTIVMPYMRPAARNFMNSAMLKHGERIAIFPDSKAAAFANALAEEITRRGCAAKIVLLKPEHDLLVNRLPKKVEVALNESQVSIYLGSAGTLETEVIGDLLTEKIQKEKLTRHISVGELSEGLIRKALIVKPEPMRRLTRAVYNAVKNSHAMQITSPLGTNLIIEFNPAYAHWFPDTDVAAKGEYVNSPAGETLTAPFKVNGRVVFNGVVDLFNTVSTEKTPLIMEIRDGRVLPNTVQCADKRILNEFFKKIAVENATRIGELSLPTNPWLPKMKIASTLVEEKRNVALAIGDPLPYDTGCRGYRCISNGKIIHVDMTIPNATVTVDGRQLMINGKYINKIARQANVRL